MAIEAKPKSKRRLTVKVTEKLGNVNPKTGRATKFYMVEFYADGVQIFQCTPKTVAGFHNISPDVVDWSEFLRVVELEAMTKGQASRAETAPVKTLSTLEF